MTTKKTIIFAAILVFLLTRCADTDSTVILNGHNFNSGDWLLVNKDNVKRTIKVIDDETVLSNNPTGIKVNWSEDHGYTTCDGILKLYKDGELIAQQAYLEQSYINESPDIQAAYKTGSDKSVYPNDDNDFEQLWDSLKKINNCYPTRYHTQPDDKDIIWFYKFE
jgi:hypothetical protein